MKRANPQRAASRVIMLGPALETRGSIAAVLGLYRANGLFARWPVEFVATRCDGGRWRRLCAAGKSLLRLVVLLARDGRAVLHVHGTSHASFWHKSVFMAVGMLARCPILFHLHGGEFAHFYQNECGALARWVVRFILGRTACVVVLSEAMRAWMVSVVSKPRVVCIPNPAPPPAGPRARVRRDVVLYVGRIEHCKGAFDLLAAFAALRESVPGMTLVCAGEGDHAAFAMRAARLGSAESVRLPGWVDRAGLQRLLDRAAVLVLPSYAEGLPMCLLEAMAAGVPVIASRVGAIPELIDDGVSGFLVEPGDRPTLEKRLREMLVDRRLSARMARAARSAMLERCAPERILAMLEGVYASLGVERRARTRGALPGVGLREAA